MSPRNMLTGGLQLAARQDWQNGSATEKRVAFPFWSENTLQNRQGTRVSWLGAHRPYHPRVITPYTMLSAIFPYCSWRISKHNHCTCVWKEGGFYFKEEKVPVSGYGVWNWLPAPFCHGPVVLSVKREEGNKCWTLPSMLSDREADLWLIRSGLGRLIFIGLATNFTYCFLH